jgi:hypothetical protein
MITVNVDGHPAGTYNYTIVLVDMVKNSFASTIMVTVVPVVPEYQNISLVVLAVSIISLVSVSSVILRKK